MPDEGIVCTFTTPLAFATEAVLGGCELRRGCRVDAVRRTPGGGFELDTTGGPVRARFLVNAAGLFSDELDRMLGHDAFTVTPRRGQLIVFDKLAGPLLRPHPAGGPERDDEGGAARPDRVRQPAARPDRRGPERQAGHLDDRRRARPPDVARAGG